MRWTAFALALAALALACGGNNPGTANPASPTSSISANAADPATSMAADGQGPAAVAREVTGVLGGRFDFTRTWGAEWWQFYSDSTAKGTVTHLGLACILTTHIPNVATGALEQGTFRIVAANGDEIVGTYEGSATYDAERADLVHGEAAFVVSGGTGRFEGATGSFTATFLEVLDDASWASAGVTWTLDGIVTY